MSVWWKNRRLCVWNVLHCQHTGTATLLSITEHLMVAEKVLKEKCNIKKNRRNTICIIIADKCLRNWSSQLIKKKIQTLVFLPVPSPMYQLTWQPVDVLALRGNYTFEMYIKKVFFLLHLLSAYCVWATVPATGIKARHRYLPSPAGDRHLNR